jgi:hypothetical protein
MAEQQRLQIRALATQRGYRLRFSGDTEAMAKELGRTEDVVAYTWSNQFVHGRTFALRARTDRSEDGVLLYSTRDPDGVGLLPLVATWTTRSLLLGFSGAARMFGWAVPDSVDQVLFLAAELQDQMNDSGPPVADD